MFNKQFLNKHAERNLILSIRNWLNCEKWLLYTWMAIDVKNNVGLALVIKSHILKKNMRPDESWIATQGNFKMVNKVNYVHVFLKMPLKCEPKQVQRYKVVQFSRIFHSIKLHLYS